ncbi:MAG: hypothetical protein CL877_09110 [Dehalococcoidales bacterium]|nr:hypothetical protein [Dehalococcoidales bacterium]
MNQSRDHDTGKGKAGDFRSVPNSISNDGDGIGHQTRRALLLGLALLTFGGNLMWAFLDKVPPTWDPSRHFYIALSYWHALDFNAENWWLNVLNVEPFYPPLYHLSLLPFFALFGFSGDSAVLANSLYMFVIILSTYGIGAHLYDQRTGLLAAFLVSCYPILTYMSRMCMTDVMLTAGITLAYYFFLKSENFEDRNYTFFFSLTLAASLLVKWTCLVLILPPLILGLWGSESVEFKKRLVQFAYYAGMIIALIVFPFFLFLLDEGRWIFLTLELALVAFLVKRFKDVDLSCQKVTNLVTMTGVCLLICFPWYSHHLVNILKGLSLAGWRAARVGQVTTFGVDQWLHYIHLLKSDVSTLFFVLFVIALAVSLVFRKYFRPVLFWWVVGSYILLTLLPGRDARYIMPVLPAMAIVSSVFICQIGTSGIRRMLIGATVVYGLVLFIFSGFVPASKISPMFHRFLSFHAVPNQTIWPIERVMDDIVAESRPAQGKYLTVRTLTNAAYFQRGLFRNDALLRDLPIVMKSVKRNVGELTDFFITKEDAGSGAAYWQKDINPKKKKLLEDPALRRTFPLFKKYLLPDGTYGMVFKRDVSPAKDITGVDDLDQVGERFLEALSEYPIYGIQGEQNITVSIEPTENPDDLYLGRYKAIRVKADSAVTNKIRFHDFELIFEGVQINLYDLFLNGKLILFELDQIFPRGTIHFEELEKLATKAMKGQGEAQLKGREGQLILDVSYRLPQGVTIKGEAIVRITFEPGRSIRPTLDSLSLGPISVPQVFYRGTTDTKTLYLRPSPGWPFNTDIRSVKVFPRHLEINQLEN